MPPHQGQLSNKTSQHPGQTLSLLPSQNCHSSCLFFRSLPFYRCGLLVPSVCSTLVEAVKSGIISYNKNASFRLVLCHLESTKVMAGNDGGVIAWIRISILTWTHKQNGDKERQQTFPGKEGNHITVIGAWFLSAGFLIFHVAREQVPVLSKYPDVVTWRLRWRRLFFFYRVKSVPFDTVSDKLVKYW